MTTNTNQPNPGNRDDAAQRTGAGTPNQAQPARTGQDNAVKASANTPQRDEGSRVFGSRTEPKSAPGRDGGNASMMQYLDGIAENVGKLRAALKDSARDGASQGSEWHAAADDKSSIGDPARDAKTAL